VFCITHHEAGTPIERKSPERVDMVGGWSKVTKGGRHRKNEMGPRTREKVGVSKEIAKNERLRNLSKRGAI